MATGKLKLELVDARNHGINDHVRIELSAVELSNRYSRDVAVRRTVTIAGIECGASSVYRVMLWPSDYRPVQFFTTIRGGRTTTRDPVRFPVDASQVAGISPPDFRSLDERLRRMLGDTDFEHDEGLRPLVDSPAITANPARKGELLYQALDAVRKACLLNIARKAAATRLLNGSACLDYLGGLTRLRGDRFLARVTGPLREEVQNSTSVFHEVSEALHHPPTDEYVAARSFKTDDEFGNLQLSFFRKGESGDVYLVDADIDEASGIRHAFEVIRNAVADHTTNPYDIREILLRHQALDPGYDFVFAEQATVSA